MKILRWLLLLFAALPCFAQTPVILAPLPQLQFFDQSGRPLSFGCIFTYASNSATPLTTYTDYTGSTANANPVVLSGGGSANIWIQAGFAYGFRVKSSGGVNCASGATLYTVNGIGGGLTILTTNVAYSATPTFTVQAQNQLFTITLTGNATAQPLTAVGILPPSIIWFQITQDSSGGHTFSWPANSIGGCTIGSGANQVTTQQFLWNGVNATAIGPCVDGNGPSIVAGDTLITGALTVNGLFTANGGIAASFFRSSAANAASTGLLRMASSEGIAWRNNANSGDLLLTKNSSENLVWPNGLSLGGGTALATTNQSGTGSLCLTTSCQLTTPALNGVTISGTPSTGQVLTASSSAAASWATFASVQASSITSISGDTTIASNSDGTWISKSVTMPSSGCPCRALVSYGAFYTSTNSGAFVAWIDDGTNQFATAQGNQTGSNATGSGLSASSTSSGTYANSAAVTFSGKAHPVSAGGMTVTANAVPGPQTSWLNVVILSSN